MMSEKAPVRVTRFVELEFAPRFEYGDMTQVAGVCGDNELIGFMQSLGEPVKLPMQPFLDIGVRARLAWELWKGRKEA